jgi:hypothetical protein
MKPLMTLYLASYQNCFGLDCLVDGMKLQPIFHEHSYLLPCTYGKLLIGGRIKAVTIIYQLYLRRGTDPRGDLA